MVFMFFESDIIHKAVLQPLRWRCIKFTTNGTCTKNNNMCAWRKQAIIRDCNTWSLLLLAATVWSFAHLLLACLAILAHATWPRAQPLDGSILTKFSLETWLESASFETLMDFLAFLVQKLRSEINKVII